jgi:hypothetical protein
MKCFEQKKKFVVFGGKKIYYDLEKFDDGNQVVIFPNLPNEKINADDTINLSWVLFNDNKKLEKIEYYNKGGFFHLREDFEKEWGFM